MLSDERGRREQIRTALEVQRTEALEDERKSYQRAMEAEAQERERLAEQRDAGGRDRG